MGPTRRSILASGAALPFAGWLPHTRASEGSGADSSNRSQARNIIFMVSDGMSAGVPSLAEPFSRMTRGFGTHWMNLAARRDVTRGLLRTESLVSMVTDSSAASSAWASGSMIANGAVNMLPDGTPLVPIAQLIKPTGRSVGLVTTTTITHATPAGFAAVEADRASQDQIAPQYPDKVEIALGGGIEFFSPEHRSDRRDLLAAYKDAGYHIARTENDLQARGESSRMLGVFSSGHIPYVVDQRRDPVRYAEIPSLATMTRAALKSLSRHSNGFLLLIEGGRIDHAAHDNDAAAMLWEQLSFDDAIAEALSFIEGRDDTLVIITTDHGTANPGLNGMAARYRDSTECFERLASVTASFESIIHEFHAMGGRDCLLASDEVIEVIRALASFDIEPFEAEAVARTVRGERVEELHLQHRGVVGALGQTFCNHTGIGWTGTTHTSDLALLLAFGPGADRFAGVMHHTEIFRVMCGLFGIEHENPRMSPDEARKLVENSADAALAAWV